MTAILLIFIHIRLFRSPAFIKNHLDTHHQVFATKWTKTGNLLFCRQFNRQYFMWHLERYLIQEMSWMQWRFFFAFSCSRPLFTYYSSVSVEVLWVRHVEVSRSEKILSVKSVLQIDLFGCQYNETSPDHRWYQQCLYQAKPLDKGSEKELNETPMINCW